MVMGMAVMAVMMVIKRKEEDGRAAKPDCGQRGHGGERRITKENMEGIS